VFIAAPILLFLGDWKKRRATRAPDSQIQALDQSP
jgi:hypothetical protein